MAWELDICGDEAISMPESEKCDECAEFAARLAVLEDLLAGTGRVVLEKTDSTGNKVSVTVIGTAEHSVVEIYNGEEETPDPNDPTNQTGAQDGTTYDIGPEDIGGG